MCISTMAVNLDGFQIRYPEFPRELWESPTPYSDLMQIKKDRRNPTHTKRPLNAFMLFAKIQRDSLMPNLSCNHCEISKALGKLWQTLTEEEKEPFIRGGKTLVELHRREFPDYKYRPRKKEEIKEAQQMKQPVMKKTLCRKRPAKTLLQARVGGPLIKQEPLFVGEEQLNMPPTRPGLSWDQFYFSTGSVVTPPASPHSDQMYFKTGSPISDLTYYSNCSPLAAPTSPVCQQEGATSAGGGHVPMPYSPVPSTASSSGYESEGVSQGAAAAAAAAGGPLPSPQHCLASPLHGHDDWSPLEEAEMAEELRDLEVTPLDETQQLLNPLAMFPALDLNGEDLSDLGFGL